MRHIPPLDPGFIPAWVWRRSYQRLVAEERRPAPVSVAVVQPDGAASVFRTLMLPDMPEHAEVNFRYLERTVKFLLWSRGGAHVLIAGAPFTAGRIAAAYAPGGTRAFDAEFLGRRVYLTDFRVTACEEADLPVERDAAGTKGGNLDGCRIGFDLGGSDRKVAALVDGRVVFSEEVPWDPYFQSDPAYHEHGITESLRRAADHLPKVDAIGGSAAGIYVDNEPRAGSLFRGVSHGLFAQRIRPLFKRLAAEWKVPVEVANDGDVTALAAAGMLRGQGTADGLLGLSLGTSLAGGYVAPGRTLKPWLNELAFVPVDYRSARAGAHIDEWSGDAGTGVRYHSQQALGQLFERPEVPPALPFAEKLLLLQDAVAHGQAWAGPIYESLGIYLGYSLAHFAEFYDFRRVLLLGRVTTGEGGELMISKAIGVLRDEDPELAGRISFVPADEGFKRHGQAIAAASLPRLNHHTP